MNILCDTSFLMVLCYEPIKNIDVLESKFGKVTFLIHLEIVNELTRIKYSGGIKRSKIANLSLEVIKNQTKNGNFKYLVDDENNDFDDNSSIKDVDTLLLFLSMKKKWLLATIDKNLVKRAIQKGVDVITLKNNKIFFITSKVRSNLNHS